MGLQHASRREPAFRQRTFGAAPVGRLLLQRELRYDDRVSAELLGAGKSRALRADPLGRISSGARRDALRPQGSGRELSVNAQTSSRKASPKAGQVVSFGSTKGGIRLPNPRRRAAGNRPRRLFPSWTRFQGHIAGQSAFSIVAPSSLPRNAGPTLLKGFQSPYLSAAKSMPACTSPIAC